MNNLPVFVSKNDNFEGYATALPAPKHMLLNVALCALLNVMFYALFIHLIVACSRFMNMNS
jgi:hypothetical protein